MEAPLSRAVTAYNRILGGLVRLTTQVSLICAAALFGAACMDYGADLMRADNAPNEEQRLWVQRYCEERNLAKKIGDCFVVEVDHNRGSVTIRKCATPY